MSIKIAKQVNYKVLDYIQSSGTQYIDTGIKAYKTRVKFKFNLTEYVNSNTEAIVQAYDNTGSTALRYYAFNSTNQGTFTFVTYTNTAYTIQSSKDTNVHEIDFNNNNGAYFDSTLIATSSNFTLPSQMANNLTIFAQNNTANGVQYYSKARLYYMQIYEEDTLIRDFVPVLDSNNVACLFDKVSKEVFYNQGTGTFTAGAETGETIVQAIIPIKKLYLGGNSLVEEVEYIESSGTQYIDTGFILNQDTKVEIDFQSNSSTTNNFYFGTRESTSSKRFAFLQTYASGSDYGYRVDYGTNDKVIFGYMGDLNRHTATLDKNNAYFDETLINTFTAETFTAEVPLYILALNNNGTLMQPAIAKLYSCKVYDNGTLVRDYVPCLVNNTTYALFDKVSNTVYYNAGTGFFTGGAKTGTTLLSNSNIAKRVRYAYVGVDGYAKQIYPFYDYGDGSDNIVENGYVNSMYFNGEALASSGQTYFKGNFNVYEYAVDGSVSSIASTLINHADVQAMGTSKKRFSSGTSTYAIDMNATTEDKTVMLLWTCGGYMTSYEYFTSFKLNYNGTYMTLSELVASQIIKPIVLISSSKNESAYLYSNWANMYTGGQTGSSKWANLAIVFMINKGYSLTNVQFYARYSATTTTTSSDGFGYVVAPTKYARLTIKGY